MSSSKDNLKHKFQNFNVDVEDKTIDEGWEKIKYFIPQEEKKSRVFFYWKYYLFGSLTLLSIIIFSVGVYYVNKNKTSNIFKKTLKTETVKQVKLSSNNQIASVSPKVNQEMMHSPHDLLLDIKNQNSTQARSVEANPKSQTHSHIKTKLKNSPNTFYNNSSTISEKDYSIQNESNLKITNSKDAAVPSGSDHQVQNRSQITTFNTKHDSLITNKRADVLYDNMYLIINNNLASPKIEPAIVLPPFSFGNDSLLQVIKSSYKNKISFDLFTGINVTFTTINYKNSISNYNERTYKINAQGGLAINYKFTKKLFLCTQFLIGSNNFKYEQNDTVNLVITPYVSVSSTDPYYVKSKEYVMLKSVYNKDIALGLGYVCFQKDRLSLESVLLFNFKFNSYETSTNAKIVSDTLHYNSYANKPFVGIKSLDYNFESEIKTYKTINIGLLPGFNVAYELNKSFSIIAKPSYFIDLSDKKLNTSNENVFKIKQNNLLLNFGLRVRL